MKKFSLLAAALLAPLSAFAQGGINTAAITPYTTGVINIINGMIVPVLMAIAFLYFIWGVYKYFILGAADGKAREEGRDFVLWGVIGFVVILSVWGLVAIVGQTLGLRAGGGSPTPPTFGTSAQTQPINTGCTDPAANNYGGGGACTYGIH